MQRERVEAVGHLRWASSKQKDQNNYRKHYRKPSSLADLPMSSTCFQFPFTVKLAEGFSTLLTAARSGYFADTNGFQRPHLGQYSACSQVQVELKPGLVLLTHRPLSSSLLGLPYRILHINHKKELLRGLWVDPIWTVMHAPQYSWPKEVRASSPLYPNRHI